MEEIEMTTKQAVEILVESRRQNQVMLDNPDLFFLNNPIGRLEQIKNAKARIESLTIAINALSAQ